MARSYLTPINLNKNEIQNVAHQNLSTAPASPVAGQVYYDTTLLALREYNGTAWKTVVHSGDIVDADISSSAAIALSKLATNPLARANHTGTQTASTISDFDTQVRTSRLDQMAAPTANVSLNSKNITNLLDPVNPQDAATKNYVDAARSGLDVKDSVRAATAVAGTLASSFANGSVIDGVTLVTGNRILIKDQSTGSENGIYTVNVSGAPTRATDADANAEVTAGMFTFVAEGTTNADTGWVLSTNDSITIGSTALTFVQFSGAGQLVAGNGLTKTGNTVDVVGTTNRISVAADSIDISSSYVGQTSITTLGTVTSGTWNGSTIGVANGGTGATTLTGYVKGSGTSALTASSTIPGSDVSGNITGNAANVTGTVGVGNGGTGATTAAAARAALSATGKYALDNPAITISGNIATWAVSHGLASSDVIVQLREIATQATVEVDVVITSSSVVTLTWAAVANVTAATYRVVVIG